ncbi:MAG: sulfatase-like hydrolase/transferase [Pirellulaceae bacterium]
MRREPRWSLLNPTALLVVLLCSLTANLLLSAADAPQPNFVVVLCDDLGYGDLACYGATDLKTPNIDRFAKAGLRLTDCYAAAANCSPARTGMMTGRTPYRVGVHNWIPMFSPMHVGRDEITVATLLRDAGYTTCHTGKWHLNGKFNMPEHPQPGDHGFDWWFSTQNNALPNHHNPDNFVRNGEPVGKLEGYSAQLVADEAIDWLSDRRDKSKPFFLFVCFHEPHEPIASAQQFMDLYPSDDASYSRHHGNISQMDHAFGRLIASLDKQGLRDDTLVFFTSDNGPAITRYHPHGSTGPLREKKGHVYEGGIRVPGILQWPGHIKVGTVSGEPVCGVDVLPTLCELAGVETPKDRALDGASIVPLFGGEAIDRQTPLYWQYNYASSAPKVAMRIGDWKVLAELNGTPLGPSGDITEESQQAIKTAELGRAELYNLKQDVAEAHDLAGSQPKRLAQMFAKLKAKYHEVRDESPTWPAWKFARYEAGRIEWPPLPKKEP